MELFEVILDGGDKKAVVAESISDAISFIERHYDYKYNVTSAKKLDYDVVVDPDCIEKE